MICLPAYIYLAPAVAVQRRQEAGSGLDAGLIPITAPELLRLLRDIVIPPSRRDRPHRRHWPGLARPAISTAPAKPTDAGMPAPRQHHDHSEPQPRIRQDTGRRRLGV